MAQTDRQPLVRLAELEIDPARLDEYRTLLREGIEAAVATEPGVLMLYALSVREQPNLVRIVEIYADEAAYQAHLLSPHFLEYKTLSEGMVLSLTLIETDPIMLRAKAGLSTGR